MPPVRNAAATRERLLACARKRFLSESYENVGLREIAADADVDVALVGRYFGSKEQLFKEVLRKDGDWEKLAVEANDLPAFLADLSVSKGASDSESHLERILIMLRSASSPQASALVRASVGQDVLEPLARMLSGPDAQLRAALALSVLIGTTVMRTVMRVDVVPECDAVKFRNALEVVLRAALTS